MSSASAAPPGVPVGRVSEPQTAADGSTYLLFLPPKWTAAPKSNPVMLFLHGIGGINNAKGCTNPGLTTQFPLNDPEYAARLEHIVLIPVAAQRDWRNHYGALISLVDMAVRDLGGDPSRVTLAGQGMGGQGVWQLAAMAPERFCALVACCGWVDERNGDVLPMALVEAAKSKPVWAFHSIEDDSVPDPLRKELGKTLEDTEAVVRALKAAGNPNVKLTTYPAGQRPPNYIPGHAAFEMAFHDAELFPWCAAQRLPDSPGAAEPTAERTAEHILYAMVRCYDAPFPDKEGRPPVLAVLALDTQGTSLRVVQETSLPKATGGAMVLQLNKSRSKLFVTAGTHGIAVFDVEMRERGKVLAGPVVSPTRSESLPTPLGVFPAWVTIDNDDAMVYACNFFSQDVTALPFDKTLNTCGAPIGVCTPVHPGVPEKVVANLDPNAEPGPFGAGFPENGCHPHGISLHPSGKWLVLGDLGSNNFTVYSLPIGKSFTEGPPDFSLHSHTAPPGYASYGSGPKNNVFSKDGTVLFSCNELDSSVSSYRFDESAGTLTPISACSALPQDWLDSIPPRPLPFYEGAHSGGSLCLAPNGKHLYSTNRGHDSVSCFSVGADGSLAPTPQFNVPAGGRITWTLTMPSDTLLVAINQYADYDDPATQRYGDGKGDPKRVAPPPKGPGNIRVFKRHPTSGELTPGCVLEVDEPLGIVAAEYERWGA